jgi:CRP-like cAMP-binding protein
VPEDAALDAPQLQRNALLRSLPANELDLFAPYLQHVDLPLKQGLFAANEPIPFGHFMLRGVASIVSRSEDGSIVEVATVGREGLVEISGYLGAESVPLDGIIQIPGEALRMPMKGLRQVVDKCPTLSKRLSLYTQALFLQISQTSVCNRLHPIQERCARWLLLTRDRVDSDDFQLTQEFLAQMLGVRRASVSEAAVALQRMGLIQYRRGSIRILDRKGLEGESCECHGIVKKEYERLLGEW